MSIAKDTPRPPARRGDVDDRWIARRRWARAGWTYLFMLLLSFLFLGPFLMGTLSSLKDDPNEYPPRIVFPQINPANISTAYRLGVAGGGGGWSGGLTPGADIDFSFRVRQPGGANEIPRVSVPARRPGAGLGAVRSRALANEYVQVDGPTVVRREGDVVTYRVKVTYPRLTRQQGERVFATLPDEQSGADFTATVGGQPVKITLDTPEAQQVQYTLGSNPQQPVELVRSGDRYYLAGPLIERTPLDVNLARGQTFEGADLPASDVQNFGRAQSFRNITPGILGYTFNNYQRAFRESVDADSGQSLFLRWTLNSFAIAITKALAAILFASLAGYALARFDFPGKNLLFLLVLFVQMVPLQVTFISNYLVLERLNLLNIWGLLLSTGIGAAAVFLMKQFFEGLPRELEEAAALDGATPFQTFWRVMLPQAGPALGALTITTFQGAWNDFFWPLVLLKGNLNLTLPIGMLSFREAYGAAGDYGLILAGAVLSALPVIVLFIVFQRYFVESQTGSAVKG
ncbi:carbohydrate ABC transporter permease [Deinococcus pimensis]|uniref:carbohydrate ABC transporter permease n=1 Tax=Deinococcus pimensis TaxID=309888 RepID=UPI000487F6F4|nr:carbohydrate ABC transporter permease [Deinococcus pimensis]